MRVARRQPVQPPPPVEAVSTLTVPDALIAWGREPDRAMRWSRDWAREVAELAEASKRRPLTEREGEIFLSRLEALVCEAIHADRPDLLTGLDMQTAEWLGLSYSFPFDGQKLTVGRNGLFSWSEVRVLTSAFQAARSAREAGIQAPDPADLGRVAVRVKAMLAAAFPDAEIGEAEPEDEDSACASCGGVGFAVKIMTDYGAVHCSPCWRDKIQSASFNQPAPRNRKR